VDGEVPAEEASGMLHACTVKRHPNHRLCQYTMSIYTGPFTCHPDPQSSICHFSVDLKMASVSSNPPAGNLQPNLYAAVIITPIIAIIAVSLRFLARRLVHASMWVDDWLTLVALVRYLPKKSPS
jgi:hypothetical protein